MRIFFFKAVQILLILLVIFGCSSEKIEDGNEPKTVTKNTEINKYPRQVTFLRLETEYDSLKWEFYKLNFLNGSNKVSLEKNKPCSVNLLSCDLEFVYAEKSDSFYSFIFSFTYNNERVFGDGKGLFCQSITCAKTCELGCNHALKIDISQLENDEGEFEKAIKNNVSVLNDWLLEESKRRKIL